MASQVNIFLLLFGGLQGLLLSVFFLKKKLHRTPYIFLQCYFAVMLLQLTLKVMSKTWLMDHWRPLYNISYLLPMLYGPLVYLFVSQLVLNRRFRLPNLVHFIPFFFLSFCTAILPAQIVYFNPVLDYLLDRQTGLLLQMISLILYHAIAFRCWFYHRDSNKSLHPNLYHARWLKEFIFSSFVVCSLVSIGLFLIYIHYPRGAEYRYAFVALTIFIYWITYRALSEPALFAVLKGQGQDTAVATMVPKLTVHRPPKKYASSSLKPEEMEQIHRALESTMQVQKPWLDAELTIEALSVMVKTNRHDLSRVLNQSIQKSFYDYVNGYRVEEVKQMLADPKRCNLKIAAIAYDAGFNSLSAFNDVFKKLTGLSPSQYRRHLQELSRKQLG